MVAGYYVLTFPWLRLCRELHVNFFILPPSKFERNANTWVEKLEEFILRGDYNEVLDLVEVTALSGLAGSEFIKDVESALEKTGCAYRLMNNRIETVASEEMAEAVKTSLGEVQKSKFSGSIAHLSNASTELRRQNWKQSVRESISAVESILFEATGEKKFSAALDCLKSKLQTHGALTEGWKQIYGYTSDKDGIRHAMLSASSTVDENEAIYMYGVCASFVAYLSKKV